MLESQKLSGSKNGKTANQKKRQKKCKTKMMQIWKHTKLHNNCKREMLQIHSTMEAPLCIIRCKSVVKVDVVFVRLDHAVCLNTWKFWVERCLPLLSTLKRNRFSIHEKVCVWIFHAWKQCCVSTLVSMCVDSVSKGSGFYPVSVQHNPLIGELWKGHYSLHQ